MICLLISRTRSCNYWPLTLWTGHWLGFQRIWSPAHQQCLLTGWLLSSPHLSSTMRKKKCLESCLKAYKIIKTINIFLYKSYLKEFRYQPMWDFLCIRLSFSRCKYTPHWVGHFSLLLCHLVQEVCPGNHGLQERHHYWLMGISHHHTGRSAHELGSLLPVSGNNNSVKHRQNVLNSSTYTCLTM